MKSRIIGFVVLLVVLLSCQHNIKFDKVKWQTQEDPAFPPPARKQMLKDLLTSYNLKQLVRAQVLGLLGRPDYVSDNDIVYKIIVDYGTDIDPVFAKHLEFKLKTDQSVSEVKLIEWKK